MQGGGGSTKEKGQHSRKKKRRGQWEGKRGRTVEEKGGPGAITCEGARRAVREKRN